MPRRGNSKHRWALFSTSLPTSESKNLGGSIFTLQSTHGGNVGDRRLGLNCKRAVMSCEQHHRVEQLRKLDARRLRCQLERLRPGIKGEHPCSTHTPILASLSGDSFVEMGGEFCASSIFPTVTCAGAGLCSAGSLGLVFPDFLAPTAALRPLRTPGRSVSRFASRFRTGNSQISQVLSYATRYACAAHRPR